MFFSIVKFRIFKHTIFNFSFFSHVLEEKIRVFFYPAINLNEKTAQLNLAVRLFKAYFSQTGEKVANLKFEQKFIFIVMSDLEKDISNNFEVIYSLVK